MPWARRSLRADAAVGVVALLLIGACGHAESVQSSAAAPTTTTVFHTIDSLFTPTPRCEQTPVAPDGLSQVNVTNPTLASIALSRLLFRCADQVVLVPVGGNGVDDGVRLAAAVGAPLLLWDGSMQTLLSTEITRLAPSVVWTVGIPNVEHLPAFTALRTVDPSAVDRVVAAHASASPTLHGRPHTDVTWVVSPTSPLAPVFLAASAAAGGTAVDSSFDPWELTDAIEAAVVLAPDVPDARWRSVMSPPLPGGGFRLFPGHRFVAIYGNPRGPELGVLGEQSPADGIGLIEELAAGYGADGATVVPTFEVIATVASATATADGDYSWETTVDEIRPWVEAASAHGGYVILDLQPGRTDFLTQARMYRELLALPHVGLALDPEWRLGPNQRHLRQIGSVSAAEVNDVATWLAGVVRAEGLPQKLLVIHQFKRSMLPDRESISVTDDLAVVIQMDGQGPLATKFASYRVVTSEPSDPAWWWGWKNFLDEDTPVATPPHVLDLEPVPVYVSFQ